MLAFKPPGLFIRALLFLPLLFVRLAVLLILFLPLPLLVLHLFLHALVVFLDDISLVVNQVAHVIQPSPLVMSILDVAHSLCVEHVTCWLERFPSLRCVDSFDECGEEEDHVAAFVHDWCTAERTGDFAGEFVFDALFRGLVPADIIDAVGEIDI